MPSTIRSRRALNSRINSPTKSCGPSNAAIPAIWTATDVQETELVISLVTASIMKSGKMPYPKRQPVIA